MIAEFEVVLEEGVPKPIEGPDASPLGTCISVTALPSKGARARDVRVVSPEREQIEPEFAELRFLGRPGGLRPVLPAACIGARGAIVVLLGLYRWLVLDLASGEFKSSVVLNRTVTEDSGFYRVQFLEIDEHSIVIYESGVLAISQAGEVLWHVRKMWDDEFVRTNGSGLVFKREAQGTFAVDASSGRVSEL